MYHFNHMQLHSSVALSTFTILCSYHHSPSPELKKKKGYLYIYLFIYFLRLFLKSSFRGFHGGSVVRNLPANTEDTSLTPDLEDPTYCGATKPVHHNCRTHALEPRSHNCWAHALLSSWAATATSKPWGLCHPARSHCNEKPLNEKSDEE